MTFDDYQQKSKVTDSGTEIGTHYVYLTMGLAGEGGELINKVKKIFRDDNGTITAERREGIKQELGDCLWYAAQLATAFDFTFDEIAQSNLEKLKSRQTRGTIQGSGDVR